MEDPPQDVGIDHRAADPLQGEELEVAFHHVGVEGGELVRPDVEVDADAAQIVLDGRGLEPRLLVRRDLQREREPRQRTVAVRIPIAGFVQQCLGAIGIVREAKDVRLERPRRDPAPGRRPDGPGRDAGT